MIRAAAKNYDFAAPVVSPESYDAVLAELREFDRRLSLQTRESLATEAFAYTARYDTAIARWFQEKREDFPPLMVRAFEKVLELPYGENPHQRAAYYAQVGARTHVLSMVAQLGGKQRPDACRPAKPDRLLITPSQGRSMPGDGAPSAEGVSSTSPASGGRPAG